MILLLDLGNSRVKWRLAEDGRTRAAGAAAHPQLPDLIDAWCSQGCTAACICSVAAPEQEHGLRQALARHGLRQHWVLAQAGAHGLSNRYRPASALGADRYAALVAARRRQLEADLGALVVVDVGTALTADMLTADGVFLGGVIVPGPALMRAALAHGTARVGDGGTGPIDTLPDHTAAAVSQGIAWALWGAVEGMRRRLAEYHPASPGGGPGACSEPGAQHIGPGCGILLSGGARAVLARPGLAWQPVLEVDELVLEGVACIARDLGWHA